MIDSKTNLKTMKNFRLFFLILFVSCSSVFYGQASTDSITMKKVFGGYQFYQADQRLSLTQLVEAMELNEKAFEEIKAAQSTYLLTTIVSGVGGFMVGWPLGTAVGGGEPNWALAGIGAGLILVSVPISQKYSKQAKRAVDTFNGGLETSSFWDNAELRFTMTGNGLGLKLRF
jgi:hypothetical protein